jgi:glycosyltransferase involved in cell wall biosynthesis
MIQNCGFGTTVLLPVFLKNTGREDFRLLQRSLDSIRCQDFPGPYEILVVDDGSATPVEELAIALGSQAMRENIRFVRCARNGGLVHALNRGLMESRYPFVARLDADDCWLPTKIGKQFELFARDPDLTITATGMTLVKPTGERIETHIRPGDWDGILNFFIDVGCPFPHGSVVARRDIYRLLGGYPHDPAMSHCEDYALWGIWLRFFKPAMVEEALYDYTVSTGSVSVRHADQQRAASGHVNRTFQALSPVGHVPRALQSLATVLGVNLVEAGIIAYRIWRYRLELSVPCAAVEPLEMLMPDRIVKAKAQASPPQVSLDRVLGRAVPLPGGAMTLVSAA